MATKVLVRGWGELSYREDGDALCIFQRLIKWISNNDARLILSKS